MDSAADGYLAPKLRCPLFSTKKQINDILNCTATLARQGDSILKRITKIIRPIICIAVLLLP